MLRGGTYSCWAKALCLRSLGMKIKGEKIRFFAVWGDNVLLKMVPEILRVAASDGISLSDRRKRSFVISDFAGGGDSDQKMENFRDLLESAIIFEANV